MRQPGSIYFALVLLIPVLIACEKNHEEDLVPIEASFSQTPAGGATTTLFTFDASATLEQATTEQAVFVRWDWNGDGIWDEPFSTKKTWIHRFFEPGLHEVRMEASGIRGQRDTATFLFDVEQGYSPPFPAFTCQPDSSNVLELFHFDATLTRDDEDSLETLQFRWDFDGDGIFDTPWSGNPLITHKYDAVQDFPASLEVIDPSGLSARISRTVIVNRLDQAIVPEFTMSGGHFTVEDTIRTDASASRHTLNHSITGYSWDFGDDGIWDLVEEPEPFASHVFPVSGKRKIRLRVHDDRGLYMDLVRNLEIFAFNTPPLAKMLVSSHVGNPLSVFRLDGRQSSDRDESLFDLKFRWDLDGDGKFDAAWDDEWIATAQFADTGTYVVRLRIIDTGDKYADYIDSIRVFPGNRPTGYIEDRRSETRYYGTVKIGNQWWMQENLRFSDGYLEPPLEPFAYNNQQENIAEYGGLYRWGQLQHAAGICPNGWHIPTQAEYQELFDYLGPENLAAKLLYGGSGEFHMKVGGWMDFGSSFRGMGIMTHLWTGSLDRQDLMPVAVFLNTRPGEARFVFTNKSVGYYLRCIQD